MRRKKNNDSGIIAFVLIFGLPVYLFMTAPVIFWLIFVPLAVIGIIKLITWLKG